MMRSAVNIEHRIRRFMLALLTFGLAGILVELLALAHYEDSLQLVPLGVILLTLVVIAWHVVRRGPAGLMALRVMLVMLLASGGLGIVLHARGNMEFQRDINPDLRGWPLLTRVLHASAPPALAPGVMAQLGLLGLIYTYRHPAEREPVNL
jgi:hypothetical protein